MAQEGWGTVSSEVHGVDEIKETSSSIMIWTSHPEENLFKCPMSVGELLTACGLSHVNLYVFYCSLPD